jgi:hypothetical protein
MKWLSRRWSNPSGDTDTPFAPLRQRDFREVCIDALARNPSVAREASVLVTTQVLRILLRYVGHVAMALVILKMTRKRHFHLARA